jgi:hypothetical protein
MAEMTAQTNQSRAVQVAVDRIVGFAKQFGEANLNLACHAAFPLVLTPDLLYQIWANFVPEAPWTAVARVLLSRLCRQVGYEMYEMDIAVRNLLLKELKEQFGQERLDKLADFLMDYVAQRLNGDDPDIQDLAQAQEWTALAYTRPTQVASELTAALNSRVKQQDMAEVFRLASLVETFAEPLAESGFEPLLIYSRGIGSFVRGDLEGAKVQFSNLRAWERRIAGVSLDIPTDEEETVLEFTRLGYVLQQLPTSAQQSKQSIKEEDKFAVKTQLADPLAELLVITSGGKAYRVKVQDFSPVAGRNQETLLRKLLPDSAQSESVIAHFELPKVIETLSILLLTNQGRIKRLPASELTNLTRRGRTLIALKDDDQLKFANLAPIGEQLILATSNGRLLRFEVNDQQLPMRRRINQGKQALRLRGREQLVGCVALSADENLCLVTEHGFGKRLPVGALRRCELGHLGNQAIEFKTATDSLAGMIAASRSSEAVLKTSKERLLNLRLDSVKLWGKGGAGERVIQLQPEEKIVSVASLPLLSNS